MVAPLVAFDRTTLKVSFASTLVSPLMVTETVRVFSLAPKCSALEVATKSLSETVAVAFAVAKFTSNAAVLPLRVTVKVATFVPLLQCSASGYHRFYSLSPSRRNRCPNAPRQDRLLEQYKCR